jgi:hypothetical protein
MSRGWLEHYALASGMMRSAADLGWHYAVKPAEEEERAKANFRRLCQYLKDHPDLEVVGMSEAARIFGSQPAQVTRDALVTYAEELAEQQEIVFHAAYSPAEMTCAFAESLLGAEASGDLPEQIARRDVLGPPHRPVVAAEVDGVSHEELIALCRQVVGAVQEEGCLPANVEMSGGRVGISQFALLAARSYLALACYEKIAQLGVIPIPRYPRLALELDARVRRSIGEHWAMPLDFSVERLAEHARLQTWTIKPGWRRPPQGSVVEGVRYGARVSVP